MVSGSEDAKLILLGMGNPLLDIQISVADDQLHKKYGLAEDGADLINQTNAGKLLPLFDEIVDHGGKVEYIPGGSAQNTIRVCQWMTGAIAKDTSKSSCMFFGAVGKDKFGEILRKKALEASIEVHYQQCDEVKTGTCAVLCYGTKRSLVAHLGAAEHFTPQHLDIAENDKLIERAQNFYVEGYFLTVSPDAILRFAKNAAATENKRFAINLSANYICEFFNQPLSQVMPYVDILFGNAEEAVAYARSNGFAEEVNNNVGSIALRIAAQNKENPRARIVVITQGSEQVYVAHKGELLEFPVEEIAPEKIVDTNGAGDAFCGGFLAAMSAGRPLEKCVKAGVFAARTIIQHTGCTFPSNCGYKY